MPKFRTQRTPELLVGEYTTARLTLAEASSAKYVKGTVLVMDDTTGKLKVFSSDTEAKVNYDLYILLENEVTADKDKTVSVVSSGKINAGKIVLNKSGDKLTTAVNGCQISGWLNTKFRIVNFQNFDNYLKD
uniref:hypothetical protein n=1 Tax=Brachyspira catarrhinii TaxID=2528966 RepID=UPI003F4B34CD